MDWFYINPHHVVGFVDRVEPPRYNGGLVEGFGVLRRNRFQAQPVVPYLFGNVTQTQ